MFHRTARLFLRPQFAEDAAVSPLAGLDRDWAKPGSEALVWLVILPGETGAPAIGAAHMIESAEGVEISVWIAPSYRRNGYGSEALAALVSMAAALGKKLAKTPSFAGNPTFRRALKRTGFTPSGKVPAGFAGTQGQLSQAMADRLTNDGESPERPEPPLVAA